MSTDMQLRQFLNVCIKICEVLTVGRVISSQLEENFWFKKLSKKKKIVYSLDLRSKLGVTTGE